MYPTRDETRAVLRHRQFLWPASRKYAKQEASRCGNRLSHRQASIGEQFKVMEALDTEKPSDLSEQECKALIEVLELRNMLSDMQQEAI